MAKLFPVTLVKVVDAKVEEPILKILLDLIVVKLPVLLVI